MNTSKTRLSLVATCSLALFALPSAFAGKDADSHFKKMDADGDGKITRAEHAMGAKQMFAMCDTNQDRSVTATEMDAAMVAQGEKPGKHDKSSVEKIREIDQNGDGQLTTTEHEAGSEKMFALMDKDADGTLSKDEVKSAMKMMKKET